MLICLTLLVERDVTVGPDAAKEKPDASQTGHPSLIGIAVCSHLVERKKREKKKTNEK